MKTFLITLLCLISVITKSQTKWYHTEGMASIGGSISTKANVGLYVVFGAYLKAGLTGSIGGIVEPMADTCGANFPVMLGYCFKPFANAYNTLSYLEVNPQIGYRFYHFTNDNFDKYLNKDGEGFVYGLALHHGIKMFQVQYHVPNNTVYFQLSALFNFEFTK